MTGQCCLSVSEKQIANERTHDPHEAHKKSLINELYMWYEAIVHGTSLHCFHEQLSDKALPHEVPCAKISVTCQDCPHQISFWPAASVPHGITTISGSGTVPVATVYLPRH